MARRWVCACVAGIFTMTLSAVPARADRCSSLILRGEYAAALVAVGEEDEGRVDPSRLVSVARREALAGRVEDSLAWLRGAVARGFTDLARLQIDSAFEKVRALPGFAELAGFVRGRLMAEEEARGLELVRGDVTKVRIHADGTTAMTLALTWDEDGLGVDATVQDASPSEGPRSWRYGDGLMLTFAFPEKDAPDTSRYYTFAFSLERSLPVALLVARSGKNLLLPVPELEPGIAYDRDRREFHYQLHLPWSRLSPFRPLLDGQAGLNVVAIDRTSAGERRVLSLVSDPDYDGELYHRRRFVPVRFRAGEGNGFDIEAAVAQRVITGTTVRVLVAAAGSRTERQAEVTVRDVAGLPVARDHVTLPAGGPARASVDIALRGGGGLYVAEIRSGRTLWRETFFRLVPGRLEELEQKIERAGARARGLLGEASTDTLRYHLSALRNDLARRAPRDDPEGVVRALATLERLLGRMSRDGSVFFSPGYLLAAYRAAEDGSLHPYSLVVPPGLDPGRSVSLVLVLHGSGVDEVGVVREAGARLAPPFLVVGVRGRDLAGWYTGADEREILEILAEVRRLYRVSRTFAVGFSMGGYGAWRLALLHPGEVDGAAIVAGSPSNLRDPSPANDMREHLAKALPVPFLVIHGTDDPVLPIASTDELVRAIERDGGTVSYRRVPDGGHGDFDAWSMIRPWLESLAAAAR